MNGDVRVLSGERGLRELVAESDADVFINSLVGFAGLAPTIEALERGKIVALANKETLVVAGAVVTEIAREHGATIIPIDSEHSAILQCMLGERPENIAKLILTASGGPFLNIDKHRFSALTVDAALKHPNWQMGNKITIDSATLMNKGLEIIEAHWLFGLPAERIDVVIHPQSIIHSMVEFVDGSVKAQLGVPDMKIPIQYALTYPERAPSIYNRVSFGDLGMMTFQKPDRTKFECLDLAYDALRTGGTAPAILNAANEVAVAAFLNRTIGFHQIPMLIRQALENLPVNAVASLESIVEFDRCTRAFVQQACEQLN
jgi:1-deoxy-D-xylulose-5-phosphate reductoisomerase